MDTITKEQIEKCFDGKNHQTDVLIALYKIAFPDWDAIIEINGYPKIGKKASLLIWDKFIKFDKEHHPGVVNGGLYLNKGFSTDEKLGDWELSTENVEVIYEKGKKAA